MKAFSFLTLAFIFSAVSLAPAAQAAHERAIYLEVERGAEHLPLKRLLAAQTGSDASDYELRGVTLHRSKKDTRRARRYQDEGAASLRVGREHTGYQSLNGRSTYIHAPRSHGRAWQLHLTPGTRIRGVTLHVEPTRYHRRARDMARTLDPFWPRIGRDRHNRHDRHDRHDRYCRH